MDECNNVIASINKKYEYCNEADKWELLKHDIVEIAKNRGKALARKSKEAYMVLNKRLNDINKQEPSSFDIEYHKQAIVNKINELVEKETEAAAFRSHCRYV